MLHNQNLIRRAALMVAAMLLSVTTVMALPEDDPSRREGVPVARELEIRTYQDTPYRGTFLSAGGKGEITYRVVEEPKRGTVTVEGESFTYTPDKGKYGEDEFAYVAQDAEGRLSEPAEVEVTISKNRSGVRYADTANTAAAAAAQYLAEEGIFVGAKMGDQYFFEPERSVTRSEFLVMSMEAAGEEASAVTMTGFCDDTAIPVWAKAYASAGLAEGLIQGSVTPEGVAFRGDDTITFNEAAVILNRVLAVSDVDLNVWYADRETVPSWAAQAVGNMESVNVMAVGSFGSSALNNGITRADAAQMLASAAILLEGEQEGLFDWLIY